jgi:hypothetical protein
MFLKKYELFIFSLSEKYIISTRPQRTQIYEINRFRHAVEGQDNGQRQDNAST